MSLTQKEVEEELVFCIQELKKKFNVNNQTIIVSLFDILKSMTIMEMDVE